MPKPLSVVKAETVSGTRTGTGRGSNNNKPHQHHHHLHHYYWWWCCCCSRHQHNHSNRKGLSSQTFGLVVLGAMFLSLALNVYLSAKLGMLENIQTMEQDFIQRWTSSSSSSTSTSSAESVAALSLLSTVVANNNVNARTSIPLRDTTGGHNLAGLRCEKFGGPSPEVAQEMVYWEDIPSDSMYVSPFKRTDQRQYLSFEPDDGGWNNIRMNMETVLATAFAMGRTLVLPPEKEFYLLGKDTGEHGGEQKKTFSFSHFFHMESIHNEHVGLDIISMTEYLETVAMRGNMIDRYTTKVAFPPNNRTNWDGANGKELKQLYTYLRASSHTAVWTPEECLAAFPQSPDPKDEQALNDLVDQILVPANNQQKGMPKWESYVDKPTPVDAPPLERLKENWASRKRLCIYNQLLQGQTSVHMPTDPTLDARLLVHFYAFLFFQSWQQDLWMKRFIRDHVRYVDEIQCAAARVVEAVRNRVRQRQPNNNDGAFDAFHIRRGDFQYKATRLDADKIYEISKSKLVPGDTVYIATDERDKSFFNPLKEHYDVVFLDDFISALGKQVNTNYYGMIDQLVASRGRTFFGCWFSTFTAYINRLRGYHADNHKEPGYEMGIHNSWYYAMEDRFDHMQHYYPVKQAFYAREFPTSWRLIDTGVDNQ